MTKSTWTVSPARLRVLRLVGGGRSVRGIAKSLRLNSPNAVHEHLRGAREDGLAETDGTHGGWTLTPFGERVLRWIQRAP